MIFQFHQALSLLRVMPRVMSVLPKAQGKWVLNEWMNEWAHSSVDELEMHFWMIKLQKLFRKWPLGRIWNDLAELFSYMQIHFTKIQTVESGVIKLFSSPHPPPPPASGTGPSCLPLLRRSVGVMVFAWWKSRGLELDWHKKSLWPFCYIWDFISFFICKIISSRDWADGSVWGTPSDGGTE